MVKKVPCAAALNREGEAGAHKALDRLASIYGRSNVYVELQRHSEREEECRNAALLNIASHWVFPSIATNGVRCAKQNDRELLDIFTAIRHHTTVHNAGRLLEQKFVVPLAFSPGDVRSFSRYPRSHRQYAHCE